MSDNLYHTELLRHAARAHKHGRLANPDASATINNPMCGDRVTFDVLVTDGHITDLSHEVRACALCQASASILSAQALGAAPADLEAIRAEIESMLQTAAPAPADPWSDYTVFTPVAAHKSRHKCVTLPFDALIEATTEALSRG